MGTPGRSRHKRSKPAVGRRTKAKTAASSAGLAAALKEALEQQSATADILRVVSSSPSDVQPVLRAVAESAARLCHASNVHIRLVDGDVLRLAEHIGDIRIPARAAPITRTTAPGRAVLDRKIVHIHDVTEPAVLAQYPDALFAKEKAPESTFRTLLVVPLIRGDLAMGTLSVRRKQKAPFSAEQIALLRTFADQAVIAIENARLFNETKEALEQQTATAEILKVIASSPTDVQPVFDVIVQRAVRLCGARYGRVYRYDGSTIHMVATHGLSANGLGQIQRNFPRPASDETIAGRVILTRRPYFVEDIERDDRVPALSREMINALGTRSQVTIPMLRAGEPIGAVTMGWDKPAAFDDQQVALLQTFADQAVIAIENVRLFNETKEALEQQTATSQVLGVISSSPTNVAPVYSTILGNVTRLCEANIAALFLYDGEVIRAVAHHNATPAFAKQLDALRVRPSRETPTRLAALERRVVHVEDVLSDPSFSLSEAHRQEAPKTVLSVPMLREGNLVGVVTVWRREARLFADKQVALVKTFADQAVIAIENVRLFNETKESLEQQTATADILKVISSSPTATQPVFEAIVESAARLFAPASIAIVMREGQLLQRKARAGPLIFPDAPDRSAAIFPIALDAERSLAARAVLQCRVIEVPDTDVEGLPPIVKSLANAAGYRSIALVPLIREGEGIGVIALHWPQPGIKLTQKQLTLVRTFADQAVIAIENVRLFNETKEALERQTATGEVLRVIAGTPADAQPVFDAIAESGLRLFGVAHIGGGTS